GDVLRSTITVVGSHGPVATLSQQLVEGDEPGPVQVEAVHPADPQNTVTHTTDGIGGLTRRHHSPWGAAVDPTDWRTVLADTDEPSGTTPGWTGHAYRTAQGLVAMGPRLYDPAVGRFLQPDVETPDPEDPFDFNRYPYVRNNPTRYTDPTGHYPEDPGDIGNPSWGLNRPGETADGSRYDLAAFMDHWLGEGATEAALEKVGATYETLRSEYNARLAWAKQTKIGGDLTLYEHAVNQAYGNAAPAVRLRVVEHSPETREVVGQLDAVPAPHGGTLADVVIRSAERKLKWRSADVQMAAPGASVALGVGRVLTPIMQKAAETLGKAGLLTSASTAHLKRQALLQTGRGLAGVTPVSLEGGGPKLVLGLAQVAGTEYRPLVAMEMATRGTSWDLLPTHLNPWSRGAATYAATNEAKVHSLISGVVSEGGSLHFNLGGMRLSRLTGPGSLDASVTEIELWTVMQPEFASRTTFYGGIHP
ncbi:MAG: RHS repeat-associated core domain-containing protein, partial [Acidimicrobiia bacterium]